MKSFDELKQDLRDLFNSGLNLKIYFGLGETTARNYFLADFDDQATASICTQYVAFIRRYLQEELSTIELSGLDGRANVLAVYDLEQKPVEFASISQISENGSVEIFRPDVDGFSQIKAVLIERVMNCAP